MRTAFVIALVAIASCSDAPSVIIEIHSDLEIPRETNSLLARVRSDGRTIEEETYALGDPPRDHWPQTLPVIAGSAYRDRVKVEIEARIAISGPSVVAAFGEAEVAFPESGSEQMRLDLARSCVDGDGDGYGIGFGCRRPDCDDTDLAVPENAPCPGFVIPDAGVPDAAGDAGPDAGPDPNGDAGAPDAGGTPCGDRICDPDQACLGNMCWKRCTVNEDCGALSLGCLEGFGVCICRAPCFNGPQDCGPYECIDGCCDL